MDLHLNGVLLLSCTECERSGGHCGFNHSEIVCFCFDGEHPKHCKNGKLYDKNIKIN